MEDRPSLVTYYSEQKRNKCGYCLTSEGSHIYGLTAYILNPEDYQHMIDRGWRRSGTFVYKSVMQTTCCPAYTIRCAAKDFKLSKTQKKIIKKFNQFLINGSVKKDRFYKATDITQPMETFSPDVKTRSPVKSDPNVSVLPFRDTVISETGDSQIGQSKLEYSQFSESLQVNTSQVGEQTKRNKCMKAKYLRIQRKRQKLEKLGLSEEEVNKKLVEKKKYPIVKTIEDYLNENSSVNKVHNLKIFLVKSSPRSKEFDRTFSVVFDLYKRYQRAIHKDPPEKLTTSQFENFLVNSPLQIKFIRIDSPEFRMTFNESALLYAKYQKAVHHESDEDCDVVLFHDFLVESPLKASKGYGSYHQQYWLDNKLIAVGVLDILPKCVSSVYFFYDPDYTHLCLGTYGALREVELTRKLSKRFPHLSYYYMGLYIHSCVKMKYKGAFKPSYLLCPETYTWHPIQECLKKLEVSKYSRFNENADQKDEDSNVSASDVLIFYQQTVMTLADYVKKKKYVSEEIDFIMEYAELLGKKCTRRMLLLRK